MEIVPLETAVARMQEPDSGGAFRRADLRRRVSRQSRPRLAGAEAPLCTLHHLRGVRFVDRRSGIWGDSQRLELELRRLASIHGVDLPALAEELILSWDELREILRGPLFSVGARTHDHYALTRERLRDTINPHPACG